MANLNETDAWPAGIYQIEEDDPVLGGPAGITNVPPGQLAARSRFQRLRSIAPWDATLVYPAGLAYVSHAATTWKSVAASTGVVPGSDAGKWVRWAHTTDELNAQIATHGTAHEAAPDPHTVYLLETAAAEAFALKAPLASPALSGNPTVPTADQFDADTSIASTAFVQRALGNFRGTDVLVAATTLGADAVGKVLSVNLGGFTITLPVGATLHPGASILILATAACAVQRNGADVIYTGAGSSTITSVAIGAGDSVFLVWNGGAWVMQGGSVQLRYAGVCKTVVGVSGYQKLPGGVIEQWGNVITNGSGVATITYPIAFPNVAASGQLSVYAAAAHYSASFDNDLGASPVGTSVRLNAAVVQKVYFRILGY